MKEKDLDSELFWFIFGLVLSWLAMQLYVAGCWMVLSVFAQAIPLWCFHRHYNPEVDYESVDTPEKQERFKKKARRRIYLIVLQMLFLLYPFFMMLPVSDSCSYKQYEGGIIVTIWVIMYEIFYFISIGVHIKMASGESIDAAIEQHERKINELQVAEEKRIQEEKEQNEKKLKEDSWIASLGHADQLIRGAHIVAINEAEQKILLDNWGEITKAAIVGAMKNETNITVDCTFNGSSSVNKEGMYDIEITLNSFTNPTISLEGFTSSSEVQRIKNILTIIKHRNGLNET